MKSMRAFYVGRHVMQKIVYLCPPPFLRLIDGLTDEMHVACVPEF